MAATRVKPSVRCLRLGLDACRCGCENLFANLEKGVRICEGCGKLYCLNCAGEMLFGADIPCGKCCSDTAPENSAPLTVYLDRALWEAEVLKRGLVVVKGGYEELGDAENGPMGIDYSPDYAKREGEDTVDATCGVWIEPVDKGALADSWEVLDAWMDGLCGKCGHDLEPGGCPACGDF